MATEMVLKNVDLPDMLGPVKSCMPDVRMDWGTNYCFSSRMW